MSLKNRLKQQLTDREFRHAYADEHLNLSIGTQIKVIREQQGLKQAELAAMIGTKQAGISRIESANYAGWSIAVLRRLAEAFDLRLRVSFEEFGTLWREVDDFKKESLQRRKFEDDPVFNPASIGEHKEPKLEMTIANNSAPGRMPPMTSTISQRPLDPIDEIKGQRIKLIEIPIASAAGRLEPGAMLAVSEKSQPLLAMGGC